MGRKNKQRRKPAVPMVHGSTERHLIAERRAELFTGMLPHPDHLARYNELYPDTAKVLVEGLAAQGEHRRALEKQAVAEGHRNARLGLWAQIFCRVVWGVVNVCCILWAPEQVRWTAGAWAVLEGGAFIYGRKKAADERREQREAEAATFGR